MKTTPEIKIPDSLDITTAEELQLNNGMKLYMLRANEFEVTRLSLVFHAGSITQSAPFVAGATANLLAEGSATMSGREIAEQLDFYGSYFEVNLDRDFAYISFCSLKRHFKRTLEMAEEILLRPIFPESEVETYRTKRRQQLAIERQKIDVVAREAFAESMFGKDHPYGISYPEEAYDHLSREQILEHYKNFYTARNAIAVCSGYISEEEIQLIKKLCEQLPEGRAATIEMPAPKMRSRHFIKRDGAVQSSIRIGKRLFTRNHPDFVGMQVVSTLLGGYFGARLMHNLREVHGYTYGVISSMVNFQHEGYFAIATQVGREVTTEALNEIFYEIKRLREELVSEQELMLAKNIMTGEMMRILDGPFGIADVKIEQILSSEDDQATNRQLQEIKSTTPERVLELAKRYLDPEEMVTVVVGCPD